MCLSSGGSAATSSTSQATNATNVTVNSSTSVPVSVDTTDLAHAIEALAAVKAIGDREQAGAQVVSAAIAAKAGPSWTTILLGAVAVLGLAFTTGLIKLPKELRA